MKINNLAVGPLQTNCYILSSDKKRAVLIDPGDEVDKLIEFIELHNLNLEYILLTHGHFDHVLALKELENKYPEAKVCISKKDVELTENIDKQLEFVGMSGGVSQLQLENITFDKFIKENDIIELDDLEIEVIETPGHTKGGISLLLNKEHLFTGDTLFSAGIGRTDLYGGDIDILKTSLKRILELSDNIQVYPGHGEESTIGAERKNLDLN